MSWRPGSRIMARNVPELCPTAGMTATVVLAEPHPLARRALAALLEEDTDLAVVVTADLASAVRAVSMRQAPVLIVARRLLERGAQGLRLPGPLPPYTRTIVLALEDEPAFAREARRAGAAAYVVEDRADGELRAHVDALLADVELTSTWPLSA